MQALIMGETTAGNSPLEPLPGASRRDYSEYFMYYNWGGLDFDIRLSMIVGDGSFSVGRTGGLDARQNLFTAMPTTDDNAIIRVDVDQYTE